MNAIIEEGGLSLVRNVNEMSKLMNEVFGAICQVGFYEHRLEYKCDFHANTEHFIGECAEFKDFVQDLIYRHILQVFHQKK